MRSTSCTCHWVAPGWVGHKGQLGISRWGRGLEARCFFKPCQLSPSYSCCHRLHPTVFGATGTGGREVPKNNTVQGAVHTCKGTIRKLRTFVGSWSQTAPRPGGAGWPGGRARNGHQKGTHNRGEITTTTIKAFRIY